MFELWDIKYFDKISNDFSAGKITKSDICGILPKEYEGAVKTRNLINILYDNIVIQFVDKCKTIEDLVIRKFIMYKGREYHSELTLYIEYSIGAFGKTGRAEISKAGYGFTTKLEEYTDIDHVRVFSDAFDDMFYTIDGFVKGIDEFHVSNNKSYWGSGETCIERYSYSREV